MNLDRSLAHYDTMPLPPNPPRPKLVTFHLPPPNDEYDADTDTDTDASRDDATHAIHLPASSSASSSTADFSPHYSSFPFKHPTTPLLHRHLSLNLHLPASPFASSPLARHAPFAGTAIASASSAHLLDDSRNLLDAVAATSAEGIRRASKRLSWANQEHSTAYDDEDDSSPQRSTSGDGPPQEPPSANGVRVWYGSYTR